MTSGPIGMECLIDDFLELTRQHSQSGQVKHVREIVFREYSSRAIGAAPPGRGGGTLAAHPERARHCELVTPPPAAAPGRRQIERYLSPGRCGARIPRPMLRYASDSPQQGGATGLRRRAATMAHRIRGLAFYGAERRATHE
jgi:hypothetical protein